MTALATRLPSLVRSVWRHRTGRRDRPRVLTYTVCFSCNARCTMCDSWRIPKQDLLSLEEIERIFAQLPRLDFVRLTGGEPFLRRDMVEISDLVTRHLRPMAVHVTTNGFLTDRIVDFCERRDRTLPLQLLVSIDGVEGKHDDVRGTRDAWNKTMATLEALAPRRNELEIELSVNQTVVDVESARQYRELRERLRPLGVTNDIVVAYKESATYSTERDLDLAPEDGSYETFGAIPREDMETLLRLAEEDTAELPLSRRVGKRYYLNGLRRRLLGEGEPKPGPPCVALSAHLRLFPNGDVPTCQFNSRVVGNLRETPFEELWESATAREQRAWVERCAGCWAECEVLPSAVYSGSLFS